MAPIDDANLGPQAAAFIARAAWSREVSSMTTHETVRRLALELPEAAEADHHGFPSYRVAGKIFATLRADPPRLMVKLDPEDQRNLAEGRPDLVAPVPGYWGRKGSTLVAFEQADPAFVESLLRLAWSGLAPKRLSRPG